jgi:hypothetical protein
MYQLARAPQRRRQDALSRRVAPSPSHPTVAAVHHLQRTIGNRAATRLLQRQPSLAPRRTKSVEDRLDEVLRSYRALTIEVGSASLISATGFRAGFLRDLQQELGPALAALAEASAGGNTVSAAELDRIEGRLADYRQQLTDEKLSGAETWKRIKQEYAEELARLGQGGDFETITATKILMDQYAETERLVGRLGASLTTEDQVQLDYMLSKRKHVEWARQRAQRAQQAAEEDLAQYEREEEADKRNLDDDDSVLKTAWDVLGWDSFGEFAADVALTVVTFGLSKWLRTAAKAEKARRRAKRIAELRKLLKARRAERAKKKYDRAVAAFKFFRGDARSAAVEQLKWLRENWSKVGRKIGTDLTAAAGQGKLESFATTAGRRAAKEWLNDSVMKYFGKTDKYERRLLQMAWAKQLKRNDDLAKTLYAAYFMLNIRRRLVVNAIYYSAVEGTSLDVPTTATLRKVAMATAGECIQDLVTAVPFFDLPVIKDLVESLRKFLVKEFEGVVT